MLSQLTAGDAPRRSSSAVLLTALASERAGGDRAPVERADPEARRPPRRGRPRRAGSLKGGGEMGVPPAAVRGFVPDEVLDEVQGPRAAGDLRELAAAAARRHGLDPGLVMAVVSVESGFRPQAVSPKGAQGLMQLMPKTASSLGVADAFDPAQNLDGGTRHLGQLLTLYGGDLARALAAYNAGEGAVYRHGGVPPYRETRAYVKKVLERYQRTEEAVSRRAEAGLLDGGPHGGGRHHDDHAGRRGALLALRHAQRRRGGADLPRRRDRRRDRPATRGATETPCRRRSRCWSRGSSCGGRTRTR